MEIWEVEEGDAPIEGLLEDGSPDPAYAAALGLVQAPLGRRAAAFALEYAVYLLLQVPLLVFMLPLLLKFATGRIGAYGFTNHPDFTLALIMTGVTGVLSLGYCLLQLALHGSKGVTLGKAAFGLRSVNVRTLEKPGFGRVLLRALVVWGAGILPFGTAVVLASPLFDKSGRGRGWHDQVGRTWLVDVREGLNPYDEKRMRIARKTHAATPPAEKVGLPSLTSSPGVGGPGYQPGARLSAAVIGRSEMDGAPAAREGGPVGGSLATPPPGAPAPAAPPAAAPPAAPVAPMPPAPPAAPMPSAQPPAPPVPAPAAPVPPAPVPPAPAPAEPTTEVPAAPAEPATATPTRTVPLPEEPAPTPAAAPEESSHLVLHLDAGDPVVIDGPVVLGRNPKSPAQAQARPVVIADEQLSRTHLLVRPVEGGIELTDLGSSNGTALVHEGVERELVAHQPTVAVAADVIQIGQRTATVRRA